MISANELRNIQISKFTAEELAYVIQQASDTIDGYVNENKDLYHKLELLAAKIEEYREEEDSIKAALITAEKIAEKIRRESQEKADTLISESEATAQATVTDAQTKADQIIGEARDYSTNLIKEKTQEAQNIVLDAEKKANEAISSAKIVAQNILDQAKEISSDLVAKSKEEKEAYELLTKTIKEDAKAFVENIKNLYREELDALESANFEATKTDEQEIDDIQSEVDSLVGEIDEIQNSIPSSIYLEDLEKEQEQIQETFDAQEIAEEVQQPSEPEFEDVEEIEEIEEIDDTVNVTEEIEEADEIEEFEDIQPVEEFETVEEFDDEPADPIEAVKAFSSNEYVPYEKTAPYISEIDEEPEMEEPKFDEEKSLFDDDPLPFENFFTIKRESQDTDRTETISLVPPEDDDDDNQPKFKGFFKKRK